MGENINGCKTLARDLDKQRTVSVLVQDGSELSRTSHLQPVPHYRIQVPPSYLPVYLMKFPVLLTTFAIHFMSRPCKVLHSINAP